MYKILGIIIVLVGILGIFVINRDNSENLTKLPLQVESSEITPAIVNTEADPQIQLTVVKSVEPQAEIINIAQATEVKLPLTDYTKILDSDIVLGSRNAKNYIIIYTSLTCPHCSDFYNKVFPVIKAELIDTHKIAYTNRSFLSDRVALTGTMLAYCNGREEYYTMLKVLFAKSAYWVMDINYLQALEKIASLAGINSQKFEQCIANKNLQDQLFLAQKEAINQLDVKAIPVIIINGKLYQGALSYEKIKAQLDNHE